MIRKILNADSNIYNQQSILLKSLKKNNLERQIITFDLKRIQNRNNIIIGFIIFGLLRYSRYEAHIIYDFFIFDIISPAMRMDKPNFGSGGPPVGAKMWVVNGATFEFTAMQ